MDATPSSALSTAKADWFRAFRLIASPFRIRDERGGDTAAREVLLDTAFGPSRLGKTCERLREGRRAASGLSFVAVADGVLVGTVRLWDVEIGDRAGLMLGPIAVDGRLRSAGIGRALMDHALRRARKLGHKGVILVGDAPYYARFGFDPALTEGFDLPGPVERARFLGLELTAGGLKGARGRIVGTGALVEDARGSRRAA
ncbi:N-acetyltransferase [Lichenihabitans sp. Uapishka_5]|uniref:GNAT family N-acetyltransferase n=1 Tax=Lichenihabitans sp. Uapishka_5 TaxID=3037302 RepID=UPI0029E80B97|nr:N-acetyltransferase [Lichenihabitans sp. Uapishka_5]MDX7951613.1 N-acetyltransferase [Lichenihabitans sp. Uapishka_5]